MWDSKKSLAANFYDSKSSKKVTFTFIDISTFFLVFAQSYIFFNKIFMKNITNKYWRRTFGRTLQRE